MPTTVAAPPTNRVRVDRRRFLAALDRVRAVVPARFPKPILTGVRLEASDGHLYLAATDGEMKLFTQVGAEGYLPPCVASCAELVRRVKASKGAACTLAVRTRPTRLLVNGGRVEHTLPCMPAEDFPPIPDCHAGQTVTLDAREFRTALAATRHAVAREPSRYAIDGILLESDTDGLRLVATDGRRLAVAVLNRRTTEFEGQVIVPARVTKLIEKLSADQGGQLLVAVSPNQSDNGERRPADIFVVGHDWVLSSAEIDGRFPAYRDVMPAGQSKFVVARQPLIETLSEVALAASCDANAVHVDLTPRRIQLWAASAELGNATAKLPARFIGGGDGTIHTGFNPAYLLDALKALDADRIVIDVGQNACGCDGQVYGKPATLYAYGDEATRCVVMPVNAGLAATRENLGSNFREEAA